MTDFRSIGNMPPLPPVPGATGGPPTPNPTGLTATGSGSGVPRSRADSPPPTKALTQAALPGPQKKGVTLVVDENTTLADIHKTFGKSSLAGKHLRLSEKNGIKVLHLHNPDKASGLFNTASRQKKHAAAANFLQGAIDRELGQTGAGRRIAKDLGVAKLVGISDLRNLLRASNGESLKGRFEQAQMPMFDRLGTWLSGRKSAERTLAKTDFGAQARSFADGLTHADPGKTFAVSAGGGGGVLFASSTDGRGVKTGVALKIEHPVMLAKADFVSKLADRVVATVKTPLPFDMPRQELLDVPKDSAEYTKLKTVLDGLASSATDDRTKDKAAEYLDSLDQHGKVAKYELLQGKTVGDLSLEERVTLFKSGLLAGDLGKAAVLLPALGLNDHVGLPGCGYTNMTNLFLGEDGRLKIIDFDTPGQPDHGGFGHSGDTIKSAIDNLVKFLDQAVKSGDAAGVLEAEIRAGRQGDRSGHPLAGILQSVLTPDAAKAGALFDNGSEGGVFQGPLNKNDATAFVAQLMRSTIEGLEYLSANADAFATAHAGMDPPSAIQNPKQTFGEIRQMIDATITPGLRQQFDVLFAQHLAPSMSI